MEIYEPEQNEFEKEINSIYRKADLLGWEIPSTVKILNDMYKDLYDESIHDEIQKKNELNNYLIMLKHAKITFERRNGCRRK
ncbi:hypothetical protein [Tissierella sp.]|uniref:hypothetical protein n=1 Tax=Tissierella sp. TaxID=41274 RepID=UPI0028553A80|nr:hypothetical protein [Tissierella sp.]MDR7856110.1 hypothetical protein [Tissierella sp.]